MARPEVYYIEDSNTFFEGQYSGRREYSLKLKELIDSLKN